MPDAKSYETLPYESHPFVWTHPSRLAALARLYDVPFVPIGRCRVLELGCASGGNLIPMAVSLPESDFVGIDISQRQVDDGMAVAAAVGANNVRLERLSIEDAGPALGSFDYIVCHGVYSWVPPVVQDKILEICGRMLTADGLAYVSYNTYPGSYNRRLLHDILTYHTDRFDDPRQQVAQGRLLLDFLAKTTPGGDGATYQKLLQGAAEMFRQKTDAYLLHEYLVPNNEPVYFHEFVSRAKAKGLGYVTDGRQPFYRTGQHSTEIEEALRQLSNNNLEREQFLDFIRNQSFRRSVLRRLDRGPVREAVQPGAVAGLQIASPARPSRVPPDLGANVAAEFRLADNTRVELREPVFKSALWRICQAWPGSVSGKDILADAPPEPKTSRDDLAKFLLDCFAAGLVEFFAEPPACTRSVGTHPTASALARHQSKSAAWVATMRQEMVELNDVDRQLIRLLDGTRDQAAIVADLSQAIAEARMLLTRNNMPLTDPAAIRDHLAETVPARMAQFVQWSLLV